MTMRYMPYSQPGADADLAGGNSHYSLLATNASDDSRLKLKNIFVRMGLSVTGADGRGIIAFVRTNKGQALADFADGSTIALRQRAVYGTKPYVVLQNQPLYLEMFAKAFDLEPGQSLGLIHSNQGASTSKVDMSFSARWYQAVEGS